MVFVFINVCSNIFVLRLIFCVFGKRRSKGLLFVFTPHLSLFKDKVNGKDEEYKSNQMIDSKGFGFKCNKRKPHKNY